MPVELRALDVLGDPLPQQTERLSDAALLGSLDTYRTDEAATATTAWHHWQDLR